VTGYLYRFGAWLMHLLMVQVEVQVDAWLMHIVDGTGCTCLVQVALMVQVEVRLMHCWYS
jgi:hypothetical protein